MCVCWSCNLCFLFVSGLADRWRAGVGEWGEYSSILLTVVLWTVSFHKRMFDERFMDVVYLTCNFFPFFYTLHFSLIKLYWLWLNSYLLYWRMHCIHCFSYDLIGGQWIGVKCVLFMQLQADCLIIVWSFKWMHTYTLKAKCTYAWVDLTWVRHTRSNEERSGAEALTPKINLSVCLSPTFFHTVVSSNDCCPMAH